MIRAVLHPTATPTPLTLEMHQAIISQSRREAAEILARARKRARAYTQRAQDRGHQEGVQKGTAQALENFKGVTEKVREHYAAAADIAHQDVILVAHHILEQTISSHLESTPSHMLGWIKEAINNLKTSRELTLRYHPRYEITMTELRPSLPSRIIPVLDATVGNADFILEGPTGGVSFAWRELLQPLHSLHRGSHE